MGKGNYPLFKMCKMLIFFLKKKKKFFEFDLAVGGCMLSLVAVTIFLYEPNANKRFQLKSFS
jgi:hypothetical protein